MDQDDFALGIEDVVGVAAPAVIAEPSPLAAALPGFDLQALLTFIPDVRAKVAIAVATHELMAIKVIGGGADALVKADAAVGKLDSLIKDELKKFALPCGLAHDLHKRMTGLRTDFTKTGADAVETKKGEIATEKKRLEREAEDARVAAQKQADKDARATANAAVRDAKNAGASPDTLTAMRSVARTIAAPPVSSPVHVPALANVVIAENWKARFVGTADDGVANPESDELTPKQIEQVRTLCRLIADGDPRVPVRTLSVDWKFLNARAKSDKRTLNIPEIEAFDEGSNRMNGSKRK